jgi:hypothetical protein
MPAIIERLIAGGFVFPPDDEIKAYYVEKQEDKDKKRLSWEEGC